MLCSHCSTSAEYGVLPRWDAVAEDIPQLFCKVHVKRVDEEEYVIEPLD